MKEMERQIRAWIGVDWADEKHDVSLYEEGTGKTEQYEIRHSPEALQEWLGQLRSRYGDDGFVAVALEQGRGALLTALMNCEFLVLYIINPKSVSATGKRFMAAGPRATRSMQN